MYDFSKTTLLPCIVARLTDAIGNRTVATSHLILAVVLFVELMPDLLRTVEFNLELQSFWATDDWHLLSVRRSACSHC